MVTLKFHRQEVDLAKRSNTNLLIYGRRKVGKTFMIKEYLDYDVYLLVKRGGDIHVEGAAVDKIGIYNDLLKLLASWIEGEKTVVIDEFQRLPDDFLDYLQALPRKGRIILTGSSFKVVRDVISPRSPILGLYSDLKLSLMSPKDILSGLMSVTEPERAIELAPYLRDPWMIPFFKDGKGSLTDVLQLSKLGIRGLIGEVFLEEERTMSQIYEGIIRSLALDHWKLGDISNRLHGRKLIEKPNPQSIRPYIQNMVLMDLVSKIPIHRRNEYYYRLRSPIMELGYYLDERMDMFQTDLPEKVLKNECSKKLPRHIEHFFGEFMAQIYGGRYEYFYTSDFDIDFIVVRGKKVLASGEVKWAAPAQKDIDKLIERTKHLPGDKVLITKSPIESDGVRVLTPKDIKAMIS